jgi:lipoprotein Spr
MKPTTLLYLFVGILLAACQPSARFRSEELPQRRLPVAANNPASPRELDQFVESWLHVPYRYGGMSKSGVDCSGFSALAIRHVYGVALPRTAAEQFAEGQKVNVNALLPGDLVFFKYLRGGGVDHVGVYLGEHRFAHATESAGVIISDLQEIYYHDRFVGACRFHD